MNREKDIVTKALAAVPSCPGLAIGPFKPEVSPGPGSTRSDGTLRVSYRGKTVTYAVEATAALRREVLLHRIAVWRGASESDPPILVANHVSGTQAELLRAEGMQFIDSAGNAFLKLGSLYLFVSGRGPAKPVARTSAGRLTARNGVKLVYALLVENRPDAPAGRPLATSTFREMASAAGVSLGSVGPVVAELRERDHLVEGPGDQRRLADCPRLVRTWVTAYAERVRPKLVRQRYRAGRRLDWPSLELPDAQVLWGGEVAAARMTRHIKPQVLTLYAQRAVRDLVLEWDLRVDEEGDVEILDFFWGDLPRAHNGGCVHPLLVYADLVASGEDRNIEVSQRVYDTHLRQHLESD